MMKKLVVFALLFGLMLFRVANADTMKDFVRISCIPEVGLLDVEYRGLHDSVARDPKGLDARTAPLARDGFHDPHGLEFSCDLGGVTYTISADQGPTSNGVCGGNPEVHLTVTRAGDQFLSDVVFGENCYERPSVMRVTVGDGPNSWRGRETQLCHATGKGTDPVVCDWTFGGPDAFGKRFPINQNRLQNMVTRQEPR
ncbi:hypothetical protein [Massilia horti]|uniref:Uncharacterized protein n=1 Tax=Massilia horti TaxID=2562153 RepID=A0A4Y9SWW4_9BURK|nr:hypothetical protein [Massilia horti]TFW31316.1 hypothetical protein E4O92_14025 [Massilia horti]